MAKPVDTEFLGSILSYHYKKREVESSEIYTLELGVLTATRSPELIDQIIGAVLHAKRNSGLIKLFIPKDFSVPLLKPSDPTTAYINSFYKVKRNE